MDDNWIRQELGKLAKTSDRPPADLDSKTRMRIREASSGKIGKGSSLAKIKGLGIVSASALMVVLVFAATMTLLQSSGPAAGRELPLGKYVSEDGLAWVELLEDNRFSFNRHLATSYWPNGTYDIQGNELVLIVSDNEKYLFSIVGDTIVFQGGKYAEPLIEKGAIFVAETSDHQSVP